MRFTKTWIAGILFSGTMAWAACGIAQAQTWQDASNADNDASAAEWQQRAVKRNNPGQWTAVHRPADMDQTSGTDQAFADSQPATNNQNTTADQNPPARRVVRDRNVFAADGVSTQSTQERRRVKLASNEEIVEPDATQYEPVATQGVFAPKKGCATCGGQGGECDSCDGGCACGDAPCGDCCDFGYEIFDGRCSWWLRNLTVFAGVDGFKNSLDHGVNGNFGTNEGLGFSGPLGDPWQCGYQISFNAGQSDFSGTRTVTIDHYTYNAAFRTQYFLTAGLFRRAMGCGLQGGIAYDYLRDSYYEKNDLQQLRSELGFVFNGANELGFYGAYAINTSPEIDGSITATSMYALYWRHTFENGGDGRIFGGATGDGDGILGADVWVPLGKSFALENRFSYVIPKEGTGAGGATREAWGLTMQLVWYPGKMANCQHCNPYRPLFNAADNTSFILRQQ
jgi:hypothetical protein